MRKFFLLLIFLFLIPSVYGEETFGKGPPIPSKPRVRQVKALTPLTTEQIERVKAFKQLIKDVDTKSLQQTVDEIAAMSDPSLELQMREAIAKTYADIVREENVTDLKKKEWLLSTIQLNMAYLQLGGHRDESDNGLHALIRRKLRDYLPQDIFLRSGFLYKLE